MFLTIAQQLKAAREQRCLSLEDVAHETRIPIVRLRQMEEGNFAAFGNMAYARSFLSHYSEFLGVDAESFIAALPQPVLGGAADYRYLTTPLGPWIQTTVRHRLRIGSRHSSAEPAESQGLHALLIFLGIGTCAAIVGVEFFSSKGLGSINQSPMSSITAPQSKRPMAIADQKTTSVKVDASITTAQKMSFMTPKGAVSPKDPSLVAANAQPSASDSPVPTEEVRPADISNLPVKRALPVSEPDQPKTPEF